MAACGDAPASRVDFLTDCATETGTFFEPGQSPSYEPTEQVMADPALESRYGVEVPLLVMPGGETLQGRFDPGEVEQAFRRAAGVPLNRLRPSVTQDQATRRRAGGPRRTRVQ